MHVIIICMYEKGGMNKQPRKSGNIVYDAQGQVTLWSGVGSGRISNSPKLIFNFGMKRIRLKKLKMWQHRFFPLQVYGDFFRRYGQLTPQSIVKSCRISHSSELLCMALLPASMKLIGCKTVEKKWRHRFPPLYSYGSHLLPWKRSSGLNWPSISPPK